MRLRAKRLGNHGCVLQGLTIKWPDWYFIAASRNSGKLTRCYYLTQQFCQSLGFSFISGYNKCFIGLVFCLWKVWIKKCAGFCMPRGLVWCVFKLDVLSQFNTVTIATTYFYEIRFCIILSCTFWSPACSYSTKFLNQHFVFPVSPMQATCQFNFILLYLLVLKNTRRITQTISSSLHDFFCSPAISIVLSVNIFFIILFSNTYDLCFTQM